MESKFIPTLQAGNGYTYLKLKGILDEDNLLGNLLSQIQGRLLLIDMAEMERINSCGVRDWVNWLNQIQALGISVILLRCSPTVVSQANMVTNFAADAFIHSFYAPYVHPDTGDEQSVLLFTEEIRKVQPIRAPKILNESGEELEFDEFEESYFAFVNDPRIMQYQVPADIQAVIEYFLPEAASRQPMVMSKAQISAGAGPVSPSGSSNAPHGLNAGSNAGFGARPAGGIGSVSAAPEVPKMSSQPMRHEQPPIPSSNGYLQAPSASPAPARVPSVPGSVPAAAPAVPSAAVSAPASAPSAPVADNAAALKQRNRLMVMIGGVVILLLIILIVVIMLKK